MNTPSAFVDEHGFYHPTSPSYSPALSSASSLIMESSSASSLDSSAEQKCLTACLYRETLSLMILDNFNIEYPLGIRRTASGEMLLTFMKPSRLAHLFSSDDVLLQHQLYKFIVDWSLDFNVKLNVL